MDNEQKCPFSAKALGGRSNRDWWPNQLNLSVLHTNHPAGNPMGAAFDYAEDHLSRIPVVVAARVARTWSLYRPLDMVSFNEGEGREAWVTRLGVVAYYPTLLAGVAGGALLWRRRERRSLWVLAVPAMAVTIGVAVSYGQTRFRAAAEPSLAELAAVAVAFAVDRWRARAEMPAAAST